MASLGLWSSIIPRTLPCQCRTAYSKRSPASPCCSDSGWRVDAPGRPPAPAVRNSGNNTQQPSYLPAGHDSTPCIMTNSNASSKVANSSNRRNSSTADVNGNSAAVGRRLRTADIAMQQLPGATIMKHLKAATNWQQLQWLVEQYSQQMNQRHSSALVTHLAQLTVSQHQLLELELPACQQGRQSQQGQLLSVQSEQQPQQPGLEFEPLIDLQQVVAGERWPSARCSSKGAEPGVQAFLRQTVAPLIDAHMQQYDARGLANVVWALARLQPMSQHASDGAAAVERYPSRRWLDTFCSTIQRLLHQCDAQQLSNTLWGLVQLQHHPPESWVQDWYAAFAQQAGFHSSRGDSGSSSSPGSKTGHSSGVRLQALSSASWSLAHLHSSSNCWPLPPQGWINSLLEQAALQLRQEANSSRSNSGNGQAVSNLLWSCVQLRQQPPQHLLRAVQEHAHAAAAAADTGHARQLLSDQALSNLMWSLARLHSNPPAGSASAGADAGDNSDEQRRQSSRQCSTPCSYSSHNVGTIKAINKSSSHPSTVLCCCAALLFSASTCRLDVMSWRHLATTSWAAGVLRLQPRKDWLLKLQQRLQQPDAAGLQDQELSLLLWGLSHFHQQHQQQSSSSQRHGSSALLLAPRVLEQLLAAQQGKLAGFSSLALHSSLLSLGRLGCSPAEPLLQVWLKEVARRNFLAGAGGQAMADVACGLAQLRRNQAAFVGHSASNKASSGSVGGSWGVGFSATGRLGMHQCKDTEWLTGFCAASASRLGACTGDQLSGIGWALAALGFRPSVAWLLSWQTAVAEAAGSMPAVAAARALWALKHLSAGASGASRESTAAQLVEAVVGAAAAGRCDVHSLAVAADCIADMQSSSRGRMTSPSTCGANDAQTAMRQLLCALPSGMHGCDSQQLLLILSAAAATQPQLPHGLLAAALQHAQLLARQHQLSNRSIAGIMAAVARLQAAAADKEQSGQQRQQQVSRRQLCRWMTCMLRAFSAHAATATELTMVLWSLAVLDYSPGSSWLNSHWLRHSQQVLARFTPSQLATAGWALTVLNHRPSDSWRKAWAQSAGGQAAAAAPSQLALLLYAAATLGCQVDRTWLLSAAASAGNSIRRWSARDLSFGLWGLAQLGLRAVAEGELLEVLFSHMTSRHIAAAMQGLSPYQLLQLLQAAVLLRPPAACGSVAAAVLGADEYWPRGRAPRKPLSKTAVRKLRWAARATAQQVGAAAAAAVAATQHHQQLLALQTPNSDCTRQLAAAAATAQDAAASWSAASAAAAAAGAALVTATTGRNPDAVGMPVEAAWVLAWCRAAVQQIHSWSPGIAAAALSALAALGAQPPLAWQQQLLQQVLHRRKQVTCQDASTISSALELLKSPLRQRWLQQLQVVYAPSSATANSVARPPQQQRKHRLSNADRKRRWQQLWLQCRRRQKSNLPSMLPSNWMHHRMHPLSIGVRYPQQFTGRSLLQLRRQHRTVRLVGWWRRQQQLNFHQRQERLLQQQRKGVTTAEAAWSDWQVNSRHRWPSPSVPNSSYPGRIMSRLTSGAGSSSHLVGAVVPSAGSVLPSRALNSSASPGGVQLAQKPVLRQTQPAADPGNVPDSMLSNSKPQGPNTFSAGTDSGTVDQQAAAVRASSDHSAALLAAVDDSCCHQDQCSPAATSSRCNGSVTTAAFDMYVADAVVVGADAGVVQAVWKSLSPSSCSYTVVSGSAAVKDLDDASRGVQFVGVHGPYNQHPGGLQQHLSWACSTN